MLATTRDAVRSILKTDPTLAAADRERLFAALADRASTEAERPAPAPRIVSYSEAADRFACTPKHLHRLCAQGVLRKVRLPGRTRCRGILESDLSAVLAGGAQIVGGR
jgi:hypothetical protein